MSRHLEKHVLTRSEVSLLLDACSETYSGVRNSALIAIMYRCGLRCGEALSLQLANLQRLSGGMVVRVEKPKGYQREDHPTPPREVGLDPKTQALLEQWLERRGTASGPLFSKQDGTGLSSQYVRDRLARLGRAAGLMCRVHVHSLRHAFASELYRETLDLVLVSRALGHANIATTATYLQSIGANPEVVARTQAREW